MYTYVPIERLCTSVQTHIDNVTIPLSTYQDLVKLSAGNYRKVLELEKKQSEKDKLLKELISLLNPEFVKELADELDIDIDLIMKSCHK